MKWALGTLALLIAAVLLRRILRLDERPTPGVRGLLPLTPERSSTYQPIALEVETQAAILGVSLNDAIEERDAGHPEIAWRLVRLAAGEWQRLAEIVKGLLGTVSKHVPFAGVLVPPRTVAAHRFKSQVMIDYVRMHEFLDQLVFRSKMRFELHLRVLRRATETLSAEFDRTVRYAERTEDWPPELWTRLDLYFHDFDLITKEALLAFRSFLSQLPHSALSEFTADLKQLLRHGVRTPSVAPDR